MVERRDLEIIFNNPIDWEFFRDKSVLVTGASGRLGMYFVEAINKADSNWNLNTKIYALARNKDKLQKQLGKTLEHPNVNILIQDIVEPLDIEQNIDYIIHTAGAASPKDFTESPVETLWGHVQGTRNILEFTRKNQVKRILYVSTVEIYGEGNFEDGIREEDMGILFSDRTRSCYPEAKRLCETMFASYKEQYGIDYVGVRLSHTLGPGIVLDDGRAFAEFIKKMIEGKDITLYSDGSAVRTYTYISDAIGGMLLALTRGNEKYYNIANVDNLISVRDLANLIAEYDSFGKVKVKYEKKDEMEYAYLPFKLGVMNVERIKELGWYPQVNVNDTFKYTIQSFL